MEDKCRKTLRPCVPCPVGVHSVLHGFDHSVCKPSAPSGLANTVGISRGCIEFQSSAAPVGVATTLTTVQGPRFDIPGPMMKTVRDPSLSLIALSGLDPAGQVMMEVPPIMDNRSAKSAPVLATWRIGFADEYLRNGVRETVEHSNGFLQALEVLKVAGAEVLPVVAQLPDAAAYFTQASSNEIDERVSEHRLDALVSDGQSPAFHGFCKAGYPGVCQIFNDATDGSHVVLWFYGARWARDSLSALVRAYQQAMQAAHGNVPAR